MTAASRATSNASVGRLRHIGGFIAGGVCALMVDLAVLYGLIWFGVPALAARPIAIALAMVVSWWINRTVTFAVTAPPTVAEFARFAAVSWFAQAVNYVVFAAILIIRPETSPGLAVILACPIPVLIAYLGFRFGVFGGLRAGTRPRDTRAP